MTYATPLTIRIPPQTSRMGRFFRAWRDGESSVEISASLHASGGRDGFTVTLRKRPLNEQCGQITSMGPVAPRVIQLALKLYFDAPSLRWPVADVGSAGVGTVVESSEEIRFPLGMFIRNACDSHPLKDLADGLHEDVLQRSKASIMPQIRDPHGKTAKLFGQIQRVSPLRGG